MWYSHNIQKGKGAFEMILGRLCLFLLETEQQLWFDLIFRSLRAMIQEVTQWTAP